ncbi:MAG: hypothetical protein AAGJ81_07320 [Verrucomicrobiota bacterium]
MWRFPPLLVLILISFLVGAVTVPLRTAIEPPAQDLSQLDGLGQSVLIGSLGGLRALAADFLWLRANYYWQEKNHGLTETTARAVTRLQPNYPYFWVETARMIVYDMPVWRMGRDKRAPPSVEKRIRRQQAERGLDLLSEASEFIPESSAIPAEKARIYWTVLDEPEEAQEYYEIAYEKPDHRALYARLRAVILLDLGRTREAKEWLEQVLAKMNPEDSPGQYAIMEGYLEDIAEGRDPRGEANAPLPSGSSDGV